MVHLAAPLALVRTSHGEGKVCKQYTRCSPPCIPWRQVARWSMVAGCKPDPAFLDHKSQDQAWLQVVAHTLHPLAPSRQMMGCEPYPVSPAGNSPDGAWLQAVAPAPRSLSAEHQIVGCEPYPAFPAGNSPNEAWLQLDLNEVRGAQVGAAVWQKQHTNLHTQGETGRVGREVGCRRASGGNVTGRACKPAHTGCLRGSRGALMSQRKGKEVTLLQNVFHKLYMDCHMIHMI